MSDKTPREATGRGDPTPEAEEPADPAEALTAEPEPELSKDPTAPRTPLEGI